MKDETVLLAHKHLQKDPILKELIAKYERPVWNPSKDLFFEIVDSIISQQLSVKAAATILTRFTQLFETKPYPTPAEILLQPDEILRAQGLSYQKIKYIKGLAQAVIDKTVDLDALKQLPDQEVITQLVKLKGIGRWTAEMILIFSLHRPDVFSIGDLGLKTAVSRLYTIDRNNVQEIERLSQSWSPYRTIASRYLWKSLDQK